MTPNHAPADDGHAASPELRTCPSCGTRAELVPALGCCPNCGHHWGLRRLETAVSVLDCVAGGTLFVVAIVVCLPTTWMLARAVTGGFIDPSSMMVAVGWHAWVWGLPVLAVAFAWRDNVLHNRPPGEGLLRMYRRVQLFTLLVPFAGAIFVLAVCGLAKL